MRIKDLILKSVGYVAEVVGQSSEGDEYEHAGTGFFVSVPSTVAQGQTYSYFATAKHVAVSLQGRMVSFFANGKDGKRAEILSLVPVWFMHPETDLAVAALGDVSNLDIVFVSVNLFATEAVISERDIGVGDDVFIVGLFAFAPGQESNMPIVRFGNISMIPLDKIYIDMGSQSKFVNAYLIEARSIGGLSGSPVFVRPTGYIVDEEAGVKISGLSDRVPYLLGMMHGHWDIKESEINKYGCIHDSQRGVNVGIGIVIPAYSILELLNDPELATMRQRGDTRFLEGIKPTPGISGKGDGSS
jgi:hypothetical protein